MRAFLEYVEDECDGREYLERVFPRFGLVRGLVLSEPIPQRRRRPAADVARAAAIYACNPRGNWPQAVADKLVCSERTAYRLIDDARDRGFLADGKLTDDARKALPASDLRPR